MTGDEIRARLDWEGGFRFRCETDGLVARIDGHSESSPSPMQMMLNAVGGCAAVDVVDILETGRQELEELTVELSGRRRADPPRRYVSLTAVFRVTGDVDPARAERAVELSFEKYCSCFHSLADDIQVDYRVEVERG